MTEFSELAMEEILANVFSIEMNTGCTVMCPFCRFSAWWKIQNIIPFDELLWMIERVNRKTLFYYATDPFDYSYKDGNWRVYTYKDVMYAYYLHHWAFPFTSTAYPEKWKHIIQDVAHLIDRFSISEVNMKRLQRDWLFYLSESGTLLPWNSSTRESVYFLSQRSYWIDSDNDRDLLYPTEIGFLVFLKTRAHENRPWWTFWVSRGRDGNLRRRISGWPLWSRKNARNNGCIAGFSS